jgi:hypothetical protein
MAIAYDTAQPRQHEVKYLSDTLDKAHRSQGQREIEMIANSLRW